MKRNTPFFEDDTDIGIDLLELVRIISKYKFLILSLVIVAVVGAIFLTRFVSDKKHTYSATATILVAQKQSLDADLFNLGIFSNFSYTFSGRQKSSVLLEIIKSKTLAQEVVEELDLLRFFFAKHWDEKNLKWEGSYKPDLNEAVLKLQTMLKVDSRVGMEVVSVTVTADDPLLAAKTANVYIEKLGGFLTKHSLDITFQELDEAVCPAKPLSSMRKNIVAAIAASLLLGILLSFVLNYMANLREHQRKREYK